VKDEAHSRLGPAEADAFLARLETLSFDITGPLGVLYGDVANVDELATQPGHVHSSAGRLDIGGGRIELPPWGFAWLTGR
jgi:hypothetical protein